MHFLAMKFLISDVDFHAETYICRLGYNHLGTTFFEIRKYASIRSLGQTAQRMVEHGLPIKCLEATVLALYLTAPIAEIDRISRS